MKRFVPLITFCLSFVCTSAFAAVQFGASVQLTGPLANTGRYYRDGYQFAVEKINAAGGVQIGNTREKISLRLLDNQSDVNLSVRQYVQLLTQDKVNFLLGPVLGAFVLSGISEVLASKVTNLASVFFGVVIVIAIVFMPRGVADVILRFRTFGWRYFRENVRAHHI